MTSINKTIAYTKNWKHTFWIALLLGMLIPLLLTTLEPFDNENDFSQKYLIISGYFFCVSIPMLLVHPIENSIYSRQANRWFLLNELLYIALTISIIFISCFFYHFYVVSGLSTFTFATIWDFIKSFGFPFTPILVPFWLYLRSKYGVIEVPPHGSDKVEENEFVTINGENKSEMITILESDFVYAQSQQNYVFVYYNSENGMQKEVFRSTLSNFAKQLPNAWQVHRSYLVNLDYLVSVEGNARKRFMKISKSEEVIPVSQKYYEALSKRLSNSSHNIQEQP